MTLSNGEGLVREHDRGGGIALMARRLADQVRVSPLRK